MPTRALAAVRHPHTMTLVAVAAAVYAAELLAVRTPAFAARPDLLSAAVAADLTLVVPFAYWALVVRRGAATLRSLLPVLALSVLGARLVLPAEHRSFVGLVRYATVPVEIAVTAYGLRGARRALRSAGARGAAGLDAAEVLEHGFVAALGDRAAARVLAAEAATLYYALSPRGADGVQGGAVEGNAAVFPHAGARSASTVWGLGLVVAVETAVVHLWLVRAHPAVAWGLVALSAYSVLWLVGHHRAVGRRPVVVAGGTLAVRVGFRFAARVPLTAIEGVDEVTWRTLPRPAPDYVDAARPGTPNVVVTLAQPAVVTGPLGLRRSVARVGLRLDDPAGFVAAVRRGRAGYDG